MSLFAISDLHLPGGDQKPMDIFGQHWANHAQRIAEDWRKRVTPGDVVVLPGDFSWAMYRDDALPDLLWLSELPGKKVLLRGNHDYWWSSLTQVRAVLPEGMYALQNDALFLDDMILCGTRGWLCPGTSPLGASDQKIYLREVERLRLSLTDAKRLQEIHPEAPLIAMMHFPPFSVAQTQSAFSDLLEEAGVTLCVYGHLHGKRFPEGFAGISQGIQYQPVSCDGLDFKLWHYQ